MPEESSSTIGSLNPFTWISIPVKMGIGLIVSLVVFGWVSKTYVQSLVDQQKEDREKELERVVEAIDELGTKLDESDQRLDDLAFSLRDQISSLTNAHNIRIENLEEELELRTIDRWTSSDMVGWALWLKIHNPVLNVPNPNEPRNVIEGVDAFPAGVKP